MSKTSNFDLIKKLKKYEYFILLLVAFSCVSTANAYQLWGGYKWPQPSTTFYVDIPGADGLWNDAFEGAMYEWGAATVFQFYIVRGTYSDPCNSSDNRNGVKFSSTDCGDAWGSTTLAICHQWYTTSTSTITQADIVFNSNESWNVYSTSWSSGSWVGVNDFRRVAVHELGHALGLGHEDSGVSTIMNALVDDTTIPQQDDINGVAALYGSACTYSISPTSGSFTSSGGNSSVSVTASSSSCAWTTSESLSWVSLSSTSGTGTGTVTITASANTGAARSGSVTIAGKIYTISQAGVSGQKAIISSPTPGSTLSGSSVTFQWNNAGANEYFLYVGTNSGSNDLFNNSAGTSTSISVTGLPTDGRTLYVTLWTRFGEQFEDNGYNSYTYTANQASCAYSISPTSGSFTSSGGNSSVSVTASSSSCAWTTSESLSWVSLSSTSGTGTGTVTITASANTGAARSGSVTIAGKIYTISQAAPPATPIPANCQSFTYSSATSPVLSEDPSQAKPIGLGTVAAGGGTLSITVNTYQFSEPVDIYFGLYSPEIDPDNIYLLTSGGAFQKSSESVAPWKANITGPINESLFGDIQASSFPEGTYYLYLLVTPGGNMDLADYYLWSTYFVNDDCDNDGDGYTENHGDCNDNDPTIHPNATEICGDGIDQDCWGGDLDCDDCDSDSTIIKYHGGEILTYNFSYNSQWDDGSGLVSFSGTETSYIYSGYIFSDLKYNCLKIITEMDTGTSSSSTNNYYFYDENGNFIQYMTTNNNFLTNQDEPTSGSRIMPNTLRAGYSWTNDPLFVVFDGDHYHGKMTFTIIKRETIRVPFGNVEAYKINYSGSFTEAVGSYSIGAELSVAGTLWVHPKIGIVKTVENDERTYWGYSCSFSYTNELVSTNWTIE